MAILLRQGLRASKHATQIAAAKEIDDRGRACGLKFYQCSWVDLFGVQRSKLVPAARIGEIASGGAGFAGFAAHLDIDPTTGDLLAMPDGGARRCPGGPRSAGSPAISSTRAPSSRQRPAAVATFERLNIVTDAPGRLARPANVLRSVLAKLEDRGLALKTGVECEFFLLGGEGPPAVADALDTQGKPCYDAHALMRRFDFIGELCEHMEALGWGPYQADHEDANGQFEINWDFDDALATADRVVFFKYMVRSLAEARGLRATFMPKPFAHLTGSGCHAHCSLHDASTGANVSGGGAGPHGLSPAASSFVAGVLESVRGVAALTNPTVNSYKRLGARSTASGATWSPNAATWAGNNRTALLRDALDALDGDAGLRAGLGDAFVDSDLKLRRAHWADYAATLSPFEFDHYLDC
ncbi:hypothetical protein JL720_12806 [Aureococcus anophagefferens]|nr:hypothetical protein JL720_12806 [Aureococcus anophagefferens]